MARKRTADSVNDLRSLALRYPEVEEGVSCDKAAFKSRGKAFLFVGTAGDSVNVMLKLRDSLPEASKLAAAEPDRYKVGGSGWTTIVFDQARPPSLDRLEKWVDESFRLLAPKTVVARFDEESTGGKRPKKAARR